MRDRSRFRYDFFLSYAHRDDRPWLEGQRGWVTSFRQALAIRLEQLLGRKVQAWWDRHGLRGRDVVSDEIVLALESTAVLVPILSPGYLASEWCRRELAVFRKVASGQGRIFKVVKTRIGLDEHPPELRDLLGYELLRYDADRDRWRELRPDSGHAEDRDAFLEKVDDLAQDLSEALRGLEDGPRTGEAAPARPPEPDGGRIAVYLAEVTADVADARDAVRRSLKQRGYRVFPQRPLPASGPELRARVREEVGRCRLAIHLLGRGCGPRPEGEERPLVELQSELTAGVRRLFWLSPAIRSEAPAEAGLGRFLERLDREAAAQRGVELLRGTIDGLVAVVEDLLHPPTAARRSPRGRRRASPPEAAGGAIPAEGREPPGPYPGLRPFRASEAHLFFGRDAQCSELLRLLDERRFLAVVGPSGSGKSSLVRAGLLPALLEAPGAARRVAAMRPGGDPIGRLASALDEAAGGGRAEDAPAGSFTETTLRRGPLGLIEAVRQVDRDRRRSYVVLIDQFEEVFRFQAGWRGQVRDDALAFVGLLLEASRGREVPICVLLTMRSDYLGDCARFPGLPEAVNGGLFLVPRLAREQLREAIVRPAAASGVELDRALEQRLLGEVGDDPDQLPLLQHALMRAWDTRRREEVLTLADYEAIGGMDEALSRHAEEAYAELDAEGRRIAERVFKRLTERSDDGREGRRPTRLDELCAVAEAPEEAVRRVIEVFQRPGRSFLTPPALAPDGGETVIDISHESLMRKWRRLDDWVAQEARASARYRRLADSAELERRGEAGLLAEPELSVTLDWLQRASPSAAWAERYGSDFAGALDFLERSRLARAEAAGEEEARRRRALRRAWGFAAVLAAAFLAALVAGLWALDRGREARALLAGSYWSNAVQAFQEGAWQRASHSFARAAAASTDEAAIGDAALDVHSLNKGVFLVAVLDREGPFEGLEWPGGGPRILAWGDDGAVRLFDARTGALAAPPMLHDDPVTGASLSSDQRLVLTRSGFTARLWDARDGSPAAPPMAHDDRVGGALFSPDDRRVLTRSGRVARLWSSRDGSPAGAPMEHAAPVEEAVFSSDGRLVLTRTRGDANQARLWNASDGSPVGPPMEHGEMLRGAAFSPRGSYVVTWSNDRMARLWSTRDGSLAVPPLEHESVVLGAILSSDERLVFTWTLTEAEVRFWNARDGSPASPPAATPRWAFGATFSADDRSVLTWFYDGTVRLWNAADGSPATPRLEHDDWVYGTRWVNGATFSADGGRILSWARDGTVRLWRTSDGSPAAAPMLHDDEVTGAAFSSDDRLVLTWSEDGTARVWHTRDGSPASSPMRHTDEVRWAAFGAGDRRILTWGADGGLRLWSLEAGSLEVPTMRHADGTVAEEGFDGLSASFEGIAGARLSADGRLVLTWGWDGLARLWHARDGSPASRPMRHDDRIRGARLSADERLVVTWSDDGTARLWYAADGSPAAPPMVHDYWVRDVAFSSDQSLLLTWSYDDTARLWNVRDGSPATPPMAHRETVIGARLTSDERRVFTWSVDSTARFWHARDGSPATPPMRHENVIDGAILSADERRVLTWSRDDTLRLWHSEDAAPATPPMRHRATVRHALLSADERLILSWSNDRTARLWHSRDGSPASQPIDHDVAGAAFTADGRRFVTWGYDGTARFWSSRDGSPATPPMRHGDEINGAAFNADESLLLTWSDDHTARLWHGRDGSPACQPMAHAAPVRGAAFSPDERHVLTWSSDGTARLWHSRDGSPAAPPMRPAGGAAFSSDGRRILTWSGPGARLWSLDRDDDFPAEHLPLLVEVVTGTAMDEVGNLQVLSADAWHAKRLLYSEVAARHLEGCLRPEANLYRSQKAAWEP